MEIVFFCIRSLVTKIINKQSSASLRDEPKKTRKKIKNREETRSKAVLREAGNQFTFMHVSTSVRIN